METESTGQNDKVPIPKRLQKWRTCSKSKAGDVIGVTSTSKREISWKLIIAFLAPLEEQVCMSISNCCIAIAMIRKQPPMVHRRREVLLTRAKQLRSRMTLTCHVRFCSRAAGATLSLRLTTESWDLHKCRQEKHHPHRNIRFRGMTAGRVDSRNHVSSHMNMPAAREAQFVTHRSS